MGSNNIQMVDTRTWEPPSWIRAFLRALVAVLTFVACWLPLVVAFSDAPESNSRAAAIAAVAIAFAALALIGHLWALRDPHRQSLQDRLFGLAVVKTKPREEPTLATPVSTRG
jgi:membrane protease YdiL (CAAX protease family)